MNDTFKSQLTALALDEVTPDERQAIEATLVLTPEARAYAAQTSEFCALLTESLGASAGAALTDEQRTDLTRELAGTGAGLTLVRAQPMRGKWVAWTMGLGAAAAIVLVSNHLWQGRDTSELAVLANHRAEVMGEMRGGEADRRRERFAKESSSAEASREYAGGVPENKALLAKRSEANALDKFGSVPDADALLGGRVDLLRTQSIADASLVPSPEPHFDTLDGSLAKMENSANQPLAGEPAAAGLGFNPAEPQASSASARYAGGDQSGIRRQGLQLSTPAILTTADGEASAVTGPVVASAGRVDQTTNEGLEQIRGLAALEVGKPASAAVPATQPVLRDDLADAKNAPVDSLLSLAKQPAPGQSVAVSESREADYYYRYSKEKKLGEGEMGAEVKLAAFQESLARSRGSLEAEAYEEVPENPFLAVANAPLSTFSIDVDTAGYANVRRFLNQGQRPPKAAVRIEEMVNYFRYDYPQPAGDAPFSVTVDMAECPWQPQHRLARIGLQGKQVARDQRPAANLVFLVDVSGSMDEPNKLPLVKQSLHLLTSQLKGSDHVALVTYAGSSGVALPSTSLEQKDTVVRAIDALAAGGSTNGASGIQLAYQEARQHFKAGGVNRVLLATDGDFNVGLTSRDDLQKLITDEAKSGVFLSVLGYGMGNLKDATMEMLSDKGNGNYAYIDSLSEARKVLAEQVEGTLMTIAKDVKIQIEFNPAHVRNYRLLGYENRMLAKEDFNDDKKDAGEIGAGHSVTALYEIVPMSAPPVQPPVDPLKYQPPPLAAAPAPAADQPVARETMTVKLRYKAPDGETSQLLEVPVVDQEKKFAEAPSDFKFASSVAMTGLLLKDSAHKGAATWTMVRDLARAGKGPDPEGYRGEFLQLVEKAAGVAP